MLKKIGLLVLFASTSAIAMLSPVQFSQLQQQFKNALAQENTAQAQQYINQLQAGGRGSYANAWQLELNAKKEAIENRKKAAADSLRAKSEADRLDQQKKAADEEIRRREAQIREEKARRDQTEVQLKAEQAKGADNRAQLLSEVHTKNAQIDQLNTQIIKLQQDFAAQRLNAETAALEAQGKCERDLAANAKKCEESISVLRSRYEQLLADAQKTGQQTSGQGQISQLQKTISERDTQVAQLQKDIAQANKQNENLKQGMPTQQANAELRTRLAETEKALQAQNKRAEDCEKQCKDSNAQLVKAQQDLKKQIDECRKSQATQAELGKQAQQSEIIRKKQDELYAANQKYEKQVLDLTNQLEQAKKEIDALKTEDNNKADQIFTLETDAQAEKQLKEKAQKELAAIQKEIREITKDLKEQKEAYAAVQMTGTECIKKLKATEEKCDAENKRLQGLVQTGKEVVAKTEKLKKEAISKLRSAIDDFIGEIRSIGSSASPEVRTALRKLDDKMTSMLRQSESF